MAAGCQVGLVPRHASQGFRHIKCPNHKQFCLVILCDINNALIINTFIPQNVTLESIIVCLIVIVCQISTQCLPSQIPMSIDQFQPPTITIRFLYTLGVKSSHIAVSLCTYDKCLRSFPQLKYICWSSDFFFINYHASSTYLSTVY